MFHDFLDGLAYGVVRGTAFFVQRLPLGITLALGRAAGTLVYFLTKRRSMAYVNLKSAFPRSTPHERRQWIRESLINVAMNGIEIMRFPVMEEKYLSRYVTHHGYERYLARRAKGKGTILLATHLGNWELAHAVEGIRARPLTVLARRQKYRRLDSLLNSFRRYSGSVFVGKGGGIRGVIHALREGRSVALIADQSGGEEGVWVRFFGRLTTAPKGPMALALKLGVDVLPVFCVRKGAHHDIFIEPPFSLVETGDREKDIQVNTQNYNHLLESLITRHPSQWLWGHKRWKRTRTQRILILSDGKTGHLKQSEALAREVIEKGKQAAPPYETVVEEIEVEFRSAERRRLFQIIAVFFLPFAQGNLGWLRHFLKPPCVEKLAQANSDLVLSAGASLVPLNLCLARENRAKSAVVMKPGFPYNLFRYDLALIPAHDDGILPRGHVRIQGVFSGVDPEVLEAAREKLSRTLKAPERIRFSLFLGGRTRRYQPSLTDVEHLLACLDRAAKKFDGDYLMTTSRRTPEAVNQFLREQIKRHPRCQLCVIASEDKRAEVVPGMMALAKTLLVTEDSLSMISEALSSGKRVVVVKMGENGLPRKHYRFQETLKTEWGIPVVEISRLGEVLEKTDVSSPSARFEAERNRVREKVGSLF